MKRVLIVDDAIDLGRLLQDALKVTHPEIPITVVPSAEEALLESTRFSFDLLVTDLRLPGMNGLELIRKIRIRQPNIKIFLMTALQPDDPLLRQKEEVKPEVFMRKPITVAEFLDAVEKLIGDPSVEVSPSTKTGTVQTGSTEPDGLLKELASVLPGEPAEPKPGSSKKVTGKLILPADKAPEPGEGGLSDVLSRLRGRLGALSTILLDESGHPVAKAGDLPGIEIEGDLSSPVMLSLSAGARVSYLLGQTLNYSVQAFRGIDLDLVLAPVGQYSLIVALKSSRSALRLALAFEETLTAQTELIEALESMGLHLQPVVEVGAPEEMMAQMGIVEQPVEPAVSPELLATPLGQDQELQKFEELVVKKTTGQLKLDDPDAFWEAASQGEVGDVTPPGVLSFEQAQKLGLFPPDKQT